MSALERYPVTLLGRLVGSATGWDQIDTFQVSLYDFIPAEGINLPKTEFLTIDYESGKASTFNEAGERVFEADLISVLQDTVRTIPAYKDTENE